MSGVTAMQDPSETDIGGQGLIRIGGKAVLG
jgi:hypothetical protein